MHVIHVLHGKQQINASILRLIKIKQLYAFTTDEGSCDKYNINIADATLLVVMVKHKIVCNI